MSIRRDGAFVRQQRLMMIAKEIAKKVSYTFEKCCNVEDLVNWTKFELGLTEKCARNYIDTVVAAKGWFYVDGAIVTELTREDAAGGVS
jgi:hypothetical protein